MNDSWSFQFILLPLLIFCARILDVPLGTLRIIFVSRQQKMLSAITGFFEVLIWLLAITQVLNNLTSWIHIFAYTIGYAAGNYVGIWIEERLALGLSMLRIVTKTKATQLIEALSQANIGYTVIDAKGASGPVHILFVVLKRKSIQPVLQLVRNYNPHAFYTIEGVHSAGNGVFPIRTKGRPGIPSVNGRR